MKKKELSFENQDEFIYGLKGLAKLLNCSLATALRIKNQLPHYQCKGTRTILFKKDEVLEAMSSQKHQTV